jgi:hypothetical protein
MYDDDYLWDRSGEPDPEVQELEKKLQTLRYRPSEMRLPWPERAPIWKSIAAAAALLIFVGTIYLHRKGVPPRPDTSPQAKLEPEGPQPVEEGSRVITSGSAGTHGQPATPYRINRGGDRRLVGHSTGAAVSSSNRVVLASAGETTSEIPVPEPAPTRFSSHIEMAQLLLRSFRNSANKVPGDYGEIAYDKRQSRELLYQNAALRKAASNSGELPTEELLGSLEPILLDIANLPEKPSSQEVRSIRDRIQREEIVGALQAYAVPLSQDSR